MLATQGGAAAIDGTELAVVTVQRRAGGADPSLTGLIPVTKVPIGAGGPVSHGRVVAAEPRVTAIGRAGVPVIATRRSSADTRSADTGVVCGAGIGVVAGDPVLHVGVQAAERRVAGINRAFIAVIAVG
jgi:hypothetical protein